jgi:hypothetical protein
VKEISEEVCAFANATGGIILIGVTDENQIIGAQIDNKKRSAIQNSISEITPSVHCMIDIIEVDGKRMTKAKYLNSKVDWTNSKAMTSVRVSGLGNPTYKPGVIEKIRRKKETTFINGKNLDVISAERAAKTMKKEFVLDNGTITTTYKENAKKLSRTCATSDLGKRRALIRKERYYSSYTCPKVVVKNALDENYSEIMTLNDARKLSPGIDKKTKEEYLGKSKFAKTMFKRNGKEHLIGLYAEILP